MNMQTIQNGNDLVILYQPLSLYLKPSANLNITINLPSNVTGKNISNFEVMDKLRQMILPDTFSLLKVSKNLFYLKFTVIYVYLKRFQKQLWNIFALMLN